MDEAVKIGGTLQHTAKSGHLRVNGSGRESRTGKESDDVNDSKTVVEDLAGPSRITSTLDLSGGKDATTVVTRDHILVRVGDRACFTHRRWFDRAEAAEMIRSLQIFVGAS